MCQYGGRGGGVCGVKVSNNSRIYIRSEEAIRNYSGTLGPNLQNPNEVERKLFEQSRNGVSNILSGALSEKLRPRCDIAHQYYHAFCSVL